MTDQPHANARAEKSALSASVRDLGAGPPDPTGAVPDPAAAVPDVVVVGAAARDIDTDDPRGWRLGGGVTYGALACARLGLRTGVLLGVDGPAADAHEIGLLEAAGAEVIRVPLATGPVFHNVERPGGRVQTCHSASAPIPIDALPGRWRAARAWMLAPVAGEVPEAWVDVPTSDARVAFGWQGVLRRMSVGELVTPLPPGPSRLVERADLIGVSRHDVPSTTSLATLFDLAAPDATILLSAGELGGMVLRRANGRLQGRAFPAVPAAREVDATGAGDVTLAALLCAYVLLDGVAAGSGLDRHATRLAATAGSLTVERIGLDAVPTRQRLEERLRP